MPKKQVEVEKAFASIADFRAGVCDVPAGIDELPMLELFDAFCAVNQRLDTAVMGDGAATDPTLLGLHREWADVCSRAASLPADTAAAKRAKAAMLLAVLEVVAPATGNREPHEMLAESLARDLLG